MILKQAVRLARHPRIAARLVPLEVEKVFFNFLHPGRKNGRAGKIRQVSIRITDICNLRCHTCGQWGDSGFLHGQNLQELKKQEVSPERYLEIFKDLVAHGHHPNVYFWGGEPTLYQGTLELIEAAAAMGLPVSIATNGTRTASVADRLVQAPLFLLQTSIDGHCAELHNSIRPAVGTGNGFADIQAGLAAVHQARKRHKRNLPLIASLTVVSQPNIEHLVDIYETFRDKVDLFIFYLSWWIDPARAQAHEEDFSRRFGFPPVRHQGWIGNWRPDNYTLLDRQLKSLLARSSPWGAPPVSIIPNITGAENLAAYYTDHRADFGFKQCISIFQAVEINSNGDLSPCRDYHDYVVGNIKDRTISELWNSEAYRKFRRSLATEGLMPVCTRCCGLMGY